MDGNVLTELGSIRKAFKGLQTRNDIINQYIDPRLSLTALSTFFRYFTLFNLNNNSQLIERQSFSIAVPYASAVIKNIS
jgi:hypothetical protein